MVSGSLRLILTVYAAAFLLLAIGVLVEAVSTNLWQSTNGYSFVIGLSLASGWFDKVTAVFNMLFGVGGGVLLVTSNNSATWGSRIFRYGIIGICLGISLISLVDIFLIAYFGPSIIDNQAGFHASPVDGVKAAITSLGLINISIVAGLVAGVGVANTGLVK